tara:strand:- start:306 stop:419 length:114 start_codon:yes stop_codon:yes gene_type:complete
MSQVHKNLTTALADVNAASVNRIAVAGVAAIAMKASS